MDAASDRYVVRVGEDVRSVLGSSLVGVYLHGSLVLGGFDPRRSDIDILVVVAEPVSSEQPLQLVEALSEQAHPCPARGLELSVVTKDIALQPPAAPPFELHLATALEDIKVVDGRGAGGDPDLVLHFAVCRQAGVLVGAGQPRELVFGQVSRSMVLAQLGDELAWAVEHAPDEYAVLNACRAWRYAQDGALVSKLAGGEWALMHLQRSSHSVLVTMALARQRGLSAARLDDSQVREFVADIRVLVDRSGTDG